MRNASVRARLSTRSPAVLVGGALALLAGTGCDPGTSAASMYATWQLSEAHLANMPSPPARRCEDLGVATVRISLTPGNLTYDFPCSAYAGETFKFSPGTYTVRVSAIGNGGQTLDLKTFEGIYVFGRTPVDGGKIVFAVP